jgi:hypothetical protein
MFTPRYMIIRDMDTFDLRENLQLGPALVARVGYGLPALGADFPALVLAATASYAVSPGGGYARLWLSLSTRLRDGAWKDQLAREQLFVATPLILRTFRIVVEGEAASARADTQNVIFFVGGSAAASSVERGGLRGYDINEISGTSMLLAHVELRSQSLRVFSQRFGALLFYDVGGAAASYSAMAAYHDAGIGLRWLIPQLNSSVIRFDLAVPFRDGPNTPGPPSMPGMPSLPGEPITRAGRTVRITAGFSQSFELL